MNKLLYLILIISYLSCTSQIQEQNLTNEKDSVKSQILENTTIDFKHIYGKWEKERSFKIGPWKEDVEYYYNKSQIDTINEKNDFVISESNIVISEKCKSNFNINKDILSVYGDDNSSEEMLLKEYGIDLNDSLFYINAIECGRPFDKIYILPDKLLIREYGAFYTIFKKSDTEKINCISPSTNVIFPFTSDDLKKYTKSFQLTDCINGNIKDFYCGEDKLRYISLLSIDSLNVIIVPMDCGDFNLFQLLVLKNNHLISNLQVDGKWYEIGDEDNYTVTKFILDKTLKLNVVVEQYQQNKLSSTHSQDYLINAQGVILKE